MRQCIDGVRSIAAAVCSRHRKVRTIPTAAPAAAKEKVVDSPSRLATLPHTALPRVIAPKNAVRKIARPRPRTHSGNATCAETNSVVIIVIHDAPAIRLAAAAMAGSCATPYSARARIVPTVPSIARRSGPSRALSQLSANDPRIDPKPIMPKRTP